jgi:hypothetical protein
VKSKKLKCIVSGKTLIPTEEYYLKKIEKAGDEETLHKTYICKDAKDLLIRGLTVDQIRKELKVREELPLVDQTIIDDLLKDDYGIKRTTMFNSVTSYTHQETDKEVKEFLNNI